MYLATDFGTQLGVIDLTTYNPDAAPSRIDSTLWTINAGSSTVQDMVVKNGRLYVAARNSGVLVYDITDIANQPPVFLGGSGAQPQTNSVAVTDDGMWVVAAEERGGGPVKLYEVQDDGFNIQLVLRDQVASTTATSAHNVVIKGSRVFVAWMEDGLRIFDIDEATQSLVEIGSHPTYYTPAVASFVGAHGVYPFLGDNRILVADMNTGLHIVQLIGSAALIDFPDGLPALIDPEMGTVLPIRMVDGCDMIVPGSARLFVRNGDGTGVFTEAALADLGDGMFQGDLPGGECGSTTDFYLNVETFGSGVMTDPPDAPREFHSRNVGKRLRVVFEDNFESDKGWILNNSATCAPTTPTGFWQRVSPVGTLFAPAQDNPRGEGSLCYITGQGTVGGVYFANDIDGGPYFLTSPPIIIRGTDAIVSYVRWFYGILYFVGFESVLTVEMSGDGGNTWQLVETVSSTGAVWVTKEFHVSDIMTPPEVIQLRFTASDCPNASVPEVGIDDVTVKAVGCTDCDLAAAPIQPLTAVTKNRFITFESGNPGLPTSVRVTAISLPPPHDVLNGQSLWVGTPQEVTENSGSLEPSDFPDTPTFFAAGLGCDPVVADWNLQGVIEVFHEMIVPEGTYLIEEIAGTCEPTDQTSFSEPIQVATSIWGDIVKDCTTTPCGPPDGGVDIVTDVTSVLDKFKNLANAPAKTRADVEPSLADLLINISDVTFVLNAFGGSAFPFAPVIQTPCTLGTD